MAGLWLSGAATKGAGAAPLRLAQALATLGDSGHAGQDHAGFTSMRQRVPRRYYRRPFVDWEHTMGAKLEQWRLADQRAHAAEMWLRGFGMRADHAKPPMEDVALARELRDAADRLFEEAMAELQLEVARRAAQPLPDSRAH